MVCSLKGPVTKFSTAILISNVLFSFHLFCSDFFCSFLLNKDYVLENAKFCSFIGNNTFVYSFLVLILTEFLLFGALFCGKSSLFASNYGFYHSLCYFPDISELTFCNTLILSACAYYLSSYYLYFLGEVSYGLCFALILAWAFLSLQIQEFRALGFHISSSSFSSVFLSLTGLHFSHVVVALILFVFSPVENSHLSYLELLFTFMLISSIQFITFIFYWHFVEFVWIVILLHFYY